jgi:CheY-like chemotaxis protein
MKRGEWVQVIDDDESIQEIIELVLRQRGFETQAASDGQTALEQLRAGPSPGLILLDMRMPRLNGLDLIHVLKVNPALASIPVLIVSGDPAAAEAAMALGAKGFLRKPFELDDLITSVQRVLPRNA